MESVLQQIEIAPGVFKRLAYCRPSDLEGAAEVSKARRLRLYARIVDVLAAERQSGIAARRVSADLKQRIDRSDELSSLELRQLVADIDAEFGARP